MSMSGVDLVRDFLKHLFSAKIDFSKLQSLLADDFTLRDPLMSADGADDYISQLRAFGDDLSLHGDVRAVVGKGEVVAALVDFQGPSGKMAYAQWFTVRDGEISGLEVIYDPRPFLDREAGG